MAEFNHQKIKQIGIHYTDVDFSLDEDQFLHQLVLLAQEKAKVTVDIVSLKKRIAKFAKVKRSLYSQSMTLKPLSDPLSVQCYYFRNRKGLFYGNLAPYFSLNDVDWKPRNDVDGKPSSVNYWDAWRQYLPNFYMKDLDSASHMEILFELDVVACISELCQRLYMGEDIKP